MLYKSPHIATMSTSCVTIVFVKIVLRVPHDMLTIFKAKYQLVLAILYEFIRHLYEFYDMCTRTTRHSYDISTSSREFVRVLHDHSLVSTMYYDILQYVTTFTGDLYDKVRFSLDFPRHRTTSIRLLVDLKIKIVIHGHYLICSREGNN